MVEIGRGTDILELDAEAFGLDVEGRAGFQDRYDRVFIDRRHTVGRAALTKEIQGLRQEVQALARQGSTGDAPGTR